MDDRPSEIEELAERIVTWLRQRLAESGAERFVLGLSGGVDSATVCALCVRAAGPSRVLGAIMPARSNPIDAEHAALAAAAFGVEPVQIDLTPVYTAFLAAMPASAEAAATSSPGQEREPLAIANVKPRLRMMTLYYLANLRDGLVVGTGNKSEAMVGYFTKYGDGGVDVLPIADLYKHEVRALARLLGVPEPIIAKAPSAGLWLGQTDEAELGISYDELDAALQAIAAGDTSAIAPPVLQRVQTLMRVSEHKRQPIPTFRHEVAIQRSQP